MTSKWCYRNETKAITRLGLVLLLLDFYYAAAAPTETNNVFDIIGGHFAKPGEYPYQISIHYRQKTPPHLCGGVIIDKSHVLTAAHCCLSIDEGSDFNIVAGGINQTDYGHLVLKEIESVNYHQNFSIITGENDICLIKIVGTFKSTKLLKPIKLNTRPTKEGTKCKISGWGYWSEMESNIEDLLKGATIPISNQKQCVANYSNYLTVDLHTMVCAGYREGGNNACNGDSGGPLVCNGKLSGLTSWSKGCARANYPAVYARVDTQIEWIKKHGVELEYDTDTSIDDDDDIF